MAHQSSSGRLITICIVSGLKLNDEANKSYLSVVSPWTQILRFCAHFSFLFLKFHMQLKISLSPPHQCDQGRMYSFGEEGMQLVQPLKFFSVTIFRTHFIGSIGMRACELVTLNFFGCLYILLECKSQFKKRILKLRLSVNI